MIPSLARRLAHRLRREVTQRRLARIFARSPVRFGRHRRVYLHHIRKTAGTSLTHGFLALHGDDPAELYRRLSSSPSGALVLDRTIHVVWNPELLRRGSFHYGASHHAAWEVELPADCYTVTCFRDPVARVLSHYRMLREYQRNRPDHVAYRQEGHWLGATFSDFLDRIPRDHLLRQVATFSRTLDVEEAVEGALGCDQVMFTERFAEDLAALGRAVDRPLPALHVRKGGFAFSPSDAEHDRLRSLLEEEYRFLRLVRDGLGRPGDP